MIDQCKIKMTICKFLIKKVYWDYSETAEHFKETIMAERRVYVDYNATTPLKEEVKAAMINSIDIYGNASSMHASGR